MNKNYNFLDFIEIGTSDFDTEIQKKDKKRGISIEPIKYYLDKLPDKENCIKIESAISDNNNPVKIYYISEENIKKYKFPLWFKGCNSINNYHPTVQNYLNNKMADKLSKIKDSNNSNYWHRTGDLGRRDKQGRIWFYGRKSR